jgi:ferredoxin
LLFRLLVSFFNRLLPSLYLLYIIDANLFAGEVLGVKVNRDVCCYCGACASVCPANCLELKETRVEADNSKCINCGACIRICPVGAISKAEG